MNPCFARPPRAEQPTRAEQATGSADALGAAVVAIDGLQGTKLAAQPPEAGETRRPDRGRMPAAARTGAISLGIPRSSHKAFYKGQSEAISIMDVYTSHSTRSDPMAHTRTHHK